MKDITQIDRFLVAFHGVISNAMLARDVGRTERWVKARVTRLKNSILTLWGKSISSTLNRANSLRLACPQGRAAGDSRK